MSLVFSSDSLHLIEKGFSIDRISFYQVFVFWFLSKQIRFFFTQFTPPISLFVQIISKYIPEIPKSFNDRKNQGVTYNPRVNLEQL